MGVVDLSYWQGRNTGWTFLPYYTYRVQVVMQKNICVSWAQNLLDFKVCPINSACRIGGEQLDRITISPNPTSNKFQLNGIDFSTDKK